MITFKRILFPVDFSERCAATVPSVQAMVKRLVPNYGVARGRSGAGSRGSLLPRQPRWATLIGAEVCGRAARSLWSALLLESFQAWT